MSTKTPAAAPPPSLAAWQARAVHTVTGPSWQRFKIRIPGIATLLEKGHLPTELVDIALLELRHEDGAAGAIADDLDKADEGENRELAKEVALERLREFAAFQRHLVCAAVVSIETEPDTWTDVTLDPESLDGLPEDDLAMIAEIVQRLRHTDARGVRLGVEPVERWEAFHEAHGLSTQDCKGCEEFLSGLSTIDVGAV